jgi:hypothetical protein
MRYRTRPVGLAVIVVSLISFAGNRARGDAAPPSQRPEAQLGEAKGVFGELPKDCVVQAIGVYRGTSDAMNVQLDHSADLVRQVEVVVNMPDRPVVLVLSGYYPIVWRVGRTERTRIVGVVVSGYHGQALIGIDKTTPYVMSCYTTKNEPFPHFCACDASPELLAMNDAVKRIVGREIDHFENKPLGGAYRVGNRVDPKQVIYSNDLKVSDFVPAPRPDPLAPGLPELPAGQRGLNDLVAEGSLRVATKADIAAWVDKASEPYKRFNENLRVKVPQEMVQLGAYVVLRNDVTLPDGLYGGHLRSFIIPDGIADPKGDLGHCKFYRMNGTEDSARTRAEAKMAKIQADAEARRANAEARIAEAKERLRRGEKELEE